MRERGFIAPAGTRAARGRLVHLTSSRVAGLLAACIVLMVGAYTIGVRHGENPVLRGVVEPQRQPLHVVEERPGIAAPRLDELKTAPADNEPAAQKPAGGVAQPVSSASNSAITESFTDRAEISARASKDAEAPRKSDVPQSPAASGALAAGKVEAGNVATMEKKQTTAMMPAPAPALRAMQPTESMQSTTVGQHSFVINGTAFIVDAPDSVRVIQDAQGRVLLIYTSDGIIRIRLADETPR
ncbi:MAG TPA: hypothetical protein VFH88_00205, partial [Candidatus Krumholzibacteria bacterium]|nr:hypothetical protein [Candidatus Krumholzibacteria bacterium]